MGILATTISIIVVAIVVIVILWVLFWWLYQRATKEVAFVRTGLGGQKVVYNGGAFVIPVLHDTIRVNMSTVRLEISRTQKNSIITRDRMRVDVSTEFYVRVGSGAEAIATAAQALGAKTARAEGLRDLLEGRFVDVLRTVAAEMTMEELHEHRGEYIGKVRKLAGEEISQIGLELESASLTSLDQTDRQFFNPNNAFDAEGLTRLTTEIEGRRLKRNAIEQDSEVGIQQKNLETETRKLEIAKLEEYARLEQEREIAVRRAEQAANIAAEEAVRRQQAEEAKVSANVKINIATVQADEQIQLERYMTQQKVEQQNQRTKRDIEEAVIETEMALKLKRIEREKIIAIEQAGQAATVAAEESLRRQQAEEARLSANARIDIATVQADEQIKLERFLTQQKLEQQGQKTRRDIEETVIETETALKLKRIEREKIIAIEQAEQAATIAREEAERRRAADEIVIAAGKQTDLARLDAEREVEVEKISNETSVEVSRHAHRKAVSEADLETKLAVDLLSVEQQKTLLLGEHRKNIAVAESARDEIKALATTEGEKQALVKAEEDLALMKAREREERAKAIAVIQAKTEAEKISVAAIVAAETRHQEAEELAKAKSIETQSEAARMKAIAAAEAVAEKERAAAYETRKTIEAKTLAALIGAENGMSGELVDLKLKLSVIENLKDIIRESARPMEQIDTIKIVEVNGMLNGANGGTASGDGTDGVDPLPGRGNLADQVVSSALRYRAQAPVVDTLLKEIGLKSGDAEGVSGLLTGQLASNDGEPAKPVSRRKRKRPDAA